MVKKATASPAVVETATVTKIVSTAELAKLCQTTPKKLRRYLRAQKYQRTDKRWALDQKIVEEVKTHYAKPVPAETEAPKQ